MRERKPNRKINRNISINRRKGKTGLVICTMVSLFCMAFILKGTVRARENINNAYIDSQLKKEAEKLHIPGMAVTIVDPEEILFAETYGECGDLDTPFIIGSVSKSFTALAVMQLAEQRKINLDEAISAYIDTGLYFTDAADGDKITVRQLLNQTGGLGTYQRFGNARITDSYGTHQYANVNYGLLGKIIEAVSGKSYADYMKDNIFLPLHMEHTAATLSESKENGLIMGYRNYFGIPVEGEPDYPDDGSWSAVSAGYISSSAADMAKYLQMYLNGGMGIVSQNSLNTMFYDSVYVDGASPYYYGMGWTLTEQYGEPVLEHSGLVENYISDMVLLPERGLGMIFLINMNDYLVADQLADRMSGNVTAALLNKEGQEITGNPYFIRHVLLNAAYLGLLTVSAYPFAVMRKWKHKKKTKGLAVFEIARHGILPALLMALPYILGVPVWVVRYFVKDVFIVLTVSIFLLLTGGIYKMVYFRGQ